MTKEFKDNLELGQEVYVKDDVRVYIYEGYHVNDTDQCAVRIKGETLEKCKWVDRNRITPLKDNVEN